MSISQQIDDANFLASKGRHLGALTILMLAVAASSRKMFPKGTRSIRKPKGDMGDGETFELFLGARLRKLLGGALDGPEAGPSGIVVEFRGSPHSIERILYTYYRCGLVHEAELSSDVEFKEHSEMKRGSIVISNNGGTIAIDVSENCLVLDTGWIELLTNAVVSAPVNGPEFGIEHYELAPSVPDEASFLSSICQRYHLTPGRVHILKHAVRAMSPAGILESSNQDIKRDFRELVVTGVINGGMVTGLKFSGTTDEHGELQEIGVNALRDVATGYERVRIA